MHKGIDMRRLTAIDMRRLTASLFDLLDSFLKKNPTNSVACFQKRPTNSGYHINPKPEFLNPKLSTLKPKP